VSKTTEVREVYVLVIRFSCLRLIIR